MLQVLIYQLVRISPNWEQGPWAPAWHSWWNLYDAIVEADNLQAAELSKTQKMRQIIGKIQSSNLNGNNDNSIQEIEWIVSDHKED